MIHMLYTFETNVLWKGTILKVNESSSNHQFSGDMSDDSYPSISICISFQPLDHLVSWRCLVVRKRWKVVRPSDIWVRAIVPCAGRIPSSTTLKRRPWGFGHLVCVEKVLENEKNLCVFRVFDMLERSPRKSTHFLLIHFESFSECVSFFGVSTKKKQVLKTQVSVF